MITQTYHRGRSVYHIDADLLRQANPDIIFTQELCEHCAVSYTEVRHASKILAGERRIVSLEPKNLEDVVENVRLIGELTGREVPAQALAESLKQRIDAVAAKTRDLAQRPSVFCMEWLSPPMFGGHWVPQMVALAGGRGLWGTAGKPGRKLDWEDVVRAEPEIIVAMPCSFALERTLKEMDRLARLRGWETLPAVRRGQLFLVDSRSYFSRHGPRLVIGLEIMAQIIHPEIFRGLIPEGAVMKLERPEPADTSGGGCPLRFNRYP